VRAWQGHKIETKCFYFLQEAFKIMLIKPDQWDNPSSIQTKEECSIKQEDNMVLKITSGYINGFKTKVPNSKLMVLADPSLTESKLDDVRFDKGLWYDWTKMSSL